MCKKGADQTVWMCRLVCIFFVHDSVWQIFHDGGRFKNTDRGKCQMSVITFILVFLVTPLVPDSCCADNKGKCTGSDPNPINGPPLKGPPIMPGYETNEHLYTEGCYDKLVGHLASHSLILGGIGACVPLLLVSLPDVSVTSLPLCLI